MPYWLTSRDVYEENDDLVLVAHVRPTNDGSHIADRYGQCWCVLRKELRVWPQGRHYRKTVLYIHLYDGDNDEHRQGI